LPPSRGITHQIDLVPSAKLPNQAAYRVTPLEHEEMRTNYKIVGKGIYKGKHEPLCHTFPTLSQEGRNDMEVMHIF